MSIFTIFMNVVSVLSLYFGQGSSSLSAVTPKSWPNLDFPAQFSLQVHPEASCAVYLPCPRMQLPSRRMEASPEFPA